MAPFAILLAGDDANSFEDHHFYANDLALWMVLLKRRFGLDPTRIAPLFVAGGTISTTLPSGSFEAAPANRDELAKAFRRAGATLEPDDPFFFIVSNHGTRAPASPEILLARSERLTPDDLREYASSLASRRQVYVFGQCGAGGFASMAGSGRAVLAGCRAEQGTYIRKDDPRGRNWQWSEFLFNLASALGAEVDGPPPHATLSDAFAFAEARSTHRKLDKDGEWPVLFDPDSVTTTLHAAA